MRDYKVAFSYTHNGEMEVEANSSEDALEMVGNHLSLHGMPAESETVHIYSGDYDLDDWPEEVKL